MRVHLVEFPVIGKSKTSFTDALHNADPSTAMPEGLPDDLNGDGKSAIEPVGDAPGSAGIQVGDPVPLRPGEMGVQDTVTARPGEMLSGILHFDLPDTYVRHRHILSHEDNEMMRAYTVIDPGLIA
ncbi:multicopper oxidase domain-containing protein [Methylobacterium segetis]|uniref:multicopper oxidase domain-containing protein n=1 Tax=Methylobacterium segetis TaxID=2488750 RepID=UPI0010472924|nr:multicopper oxidase domain-containing protein [Methylobacterium segetis]